MKKSNLALIIVLAALLGIAWISSSVQLLSNSQERNQQLQQAKQYSDKGLYQKAIACYDRALAQKNDKETRDLWLEAHKNAFEDGAIALRAYTEALKVMCDEYPKDAAYWEILIATYLEKNDLNNAYSSYTKCCRVGVVNETIAKYGQKIMYTFSVKGRAYPSYVRNAKGYYTVYDGTQWGVLDPSGESVYDTIYEYISPYNNNNEALYVADGDQRIINEKSVVQEKTNVVFARTGAYSDGILPVCDENDVWKYLDCQTDKFLEGRYENASNYMNGIAAICSKGKWMLIDYEGKQVGQTVFSDIKLHSNGDYSYDGIMIAAVNGEYGFYNEKGESLTEFKAKKMDVYMGGPVAFSDNTSKWGFVNKDGKIILEAQFADAKSFANKLAAIGDGTQWGFIDVNGNLVIEKQFIDAGYFTKQGTCMVSVQEGFYNILKLKFLD